MPLEIFQQTQESLTSGIAAVSVAATVHLAPVERVEPILESQAALVQKQVCHQSPMVGHVVNPKKTSGLVGALIGGAIASNSSAGEFRPFATTLGALIGNNIGQNMARGPYVVPENTYTHCGMGYENKVISVTKGYRVWYRFNGVLMKTEMKSHPGEYVQVKTNQ